MKKIVIFGGAFNPPHNSHFILAEQIINECESVEKVVFMPVNSKYQKKEILASNEHRYNMIKMVCDKNDNFEVSRLELDSEKVLTTIETLTLIKEQYPEKELIFTTGTDNLKELETWNEPQRIVDNFKILVLERDEDNMDEIISLNEFLSRNQKAFIRLKNNIRTNISSTFIREKIRQGKSIRYLIPDEVYKYIKANKLYEEI